MTVWEGAWDCPQCGLKKNNGPDKYCGGCGAPRGDDVEFYLPENAKEVTDKENLRKAELGPDWKCQFCGGDNSAEHKFCTGCGSGQDGSPARKTRDIMIEKPENKSVSEKKENKTGFNAKTGCIVVAAMFLLFIIIGYVFRPHDMMLTCTGFKWERSVEIERFDTYTENAWYNELPSGARILSQTQKIHHNDRIKTGSITKTREVTKKIQTGTEKVVTGKKDMGNGYFKDIYETRPVYKTVTENETYQEPVYKELPVFKTYYTYHIDRWKPSRTDKADGIDQKAIWPPLCLYKKERPGKKTENYIVFFTDSKQNNLTYEAKTESEWLKFRKENKYKARISSAGRIIQIETNGEK